MSERAAVASAGAGDFIHSKTRSSMKTDSPSHQPILRVRAAVLAVCLAGLGAPAHSQDSWQTVDSWPTDAESLAMPGLYGSSGDIAVDGWGNILAVGSASLVEGASFNDGFAILRASSAESAGGAGTWAEVERFAGPNPDDWRGAHYRGVARDSVSGRIYLAGEVRRRGSLDTAWVVRESVDDGATWQTTDFQPTLDGSDQSSCADLQVNPWNGDVFAVGQSHSYVSGSLLGRATWVVRRRSAGETGFSTVDQVVQNTGAAAWHLGFHADLGVLAVGQTEGRRSSSPGWTVRCSPVGDPDTWRTLDRFVDTKEWLRSTAQGVAVSPAGVIYVAGSAYNSKTGKEHWVVRTSTDAGATWTITDEQVPEGSGALATGVAIDGVGNPWVCGMTRSSSGSMNWLVRRGLPGTAWVGKGRSRTLVDTVVWSPSDAWLPTGWQEARANGIAADPAGHVFVSGRAMDTDGRNHWVVRRLAP